MGLLRIEGVTHWSIPVNNLDEAEAFYSDVLGLEAKGRLGNSRMSCVNVGDHNILLCELDEPTEQASQRDAKVHHSFTVTPETFEEACRVFRDRSVPIDGLVYRERGFLHRPGALLL